MVIFYSFGYKPDEFTAIATDKLSFDRYPEAMSAQLRIDVLRDSADLDPRHDPVSAHRPPLLLLAGDEGLAGLRRSWRWLW